MKNSAYKNAGVDIDAAANLVEKIKPHIKKTNRPGTVSDIGGFGALFDLKKTGFQDPVLVSSTDGVGTKIKVAIDSGLHNTIGIDLVAMCVNDILVQGAEPLFFLDYFATGTLDTGVAEDIIKSIADGCYEAGCALIGGETAEMPGLYAKGDYDLAGFSVGAVERNNIITGENIASGDILLGLSSSGLHSNGFSLVRKIIGGSGLFYDSPSPFCDSPTLADVLLTPTRIYVSSLLKVLKKNPGIIKGMAHITGGGLTENIPRILPDNAQAEIDLSTWDLPPIFKWLQSEGNLTIEDLLSTLNCGIGMVIVCAENDAEQITESLENEGETVYRIGTVQNRQTPDSSPITFTHSKTWLKEN